MPFAVPNLTRCLAVAAALSAPAGAHALESNWFDSGKAQVRLVVAGSSAKDSRVTRAGIEIRLQRGWHTYWRYAGDAGLPPQLDWSGSENLERAKVLWPAPTRIPVESGIESIGYKNSVLLPVHLFPQEADKPITLRLKFDYGVCEKICIPATATLQLQVPAGAGSLFPAIDAAEARVPRKAALGGQGALSILGAKLKPGPKPAVLVDVAVPDGRPFDLFAEGATDDWALALPKRETYKDGRARFVVPLEETASGAGPTPESVRLTLVSGQEAIEVHVKLD